MKLIQDLGFQEYRPRDCGIVGGIVGEMIVGKPPVFAAKILEILPYTNPNSGEQDGTKTLVFDGTRQLTANPQWIKEQSPKAGGYLVFYYVNGDPEKIRTRFEPAASFDRDNVKALGAS